MEKGVIGFLLILKAVVCFNTVEGMYNIIIKNETGRTIYIDACRTVDSFVLGKEKLLKDPVIDNRGQKNINMRFTVPTCDPMRNYVCLSIFDDELGEYRPILIRWGTSGIYSDSYIVEHLYRLNEDTDATSVIFSFFADSPEVIDELVKKTKEKLDRNKSSQQYICEKDIVRCSGISDQHFSQRERNK